MKNKKRVFTLALLFALLLVIFSVNFVSAYTRASGQFSQFGTYQGGAFSGFDRSMCEAGQDFILQIDPTGCVNTPVRSDLLEEQNVDVYCKVSAIKINPLIDVNAINYVSFAGQYPQEVASIGYFPAKAALGQPTAQANTFLDNIGYVRITLKRQPNETAMPDYVTGNLTASIRYDVENAFGTGQSVFYLPVLDDNEWQNNIPSYSFWQGRGYLRAESVTDDGNARIAVYSGASQGNPVGGAKTKIATVGLEERRQSDEIYLPGFDFCLGGMTLTLRDVESENTRVRLKINENPSEFKDGESFLDGRCSVRDIDKYGAVQETTLVCREDEGSKRLNLILNPSVELKIGDITGNYTVGSKLYTTPEGDRSVYLVYAGSKNDVLNSEDNLRIVVVALHTDKPNLDAEQLASLKRQIKELSPDQISSITGLGVNILKRIAGTGEYSIRALVQGQSLEAIDFNEPKEFFDKKVEIVGFSSGQNFQLDQDIREFYDNALEDYEIIVDSFSGEKYPSTESLTLGEQALRKLVILAGDLKQNEDVLKYCSDFDTLYTGQRPEICDSLYQLSNQASAVGTISVNGEVKRISFEGIKEPSFDDYGAEIIVADSDTGESYPLNLRLNQIHYFDSDGNEFIQLVEADEDSVKLRVSLNVESKIEGVKQFVLETETKTLAKDKPDRFGSKYLFSLGDVHVKKVAKVSVDPRIKFAETKAEFPFTIGIEKRAIQLTPEQTRTALEKASKLSDTLHGLQRKTDTLVKGFKTTCTVTGSVLTIKNFLTNLGGKGIARNKVMRAADVGWFDKCEVMVNKGDYEDVDKCLLDHNAEIEEAVNDYSTAIDNVNNDLDSLKEGITKERLLGEDFVDTNALFDRLVTNSFKSNLKTNIQRSNIGNSLEIREQQVQVSDIIDLIGKDNLYLSQARDLQLNSQLLGSDNEVVKQIAQQEISETLSDLWINSQEKKQVADVTQGLAAALQGIGGSVEAAENSAELSYNGFTTPQGLGEIPEEAPLRLIVYKGGTFLLQLTNGAGGKYGVKEIYNADGTKADSTSPIYEEIKARFTFKKLDSTSYRNKYENPRVRYYETGAYKGVPAIVPFDLENGWYAAVKSTTPFGGNIQPVDDSGRVSSFWLCNVGVNHREEFGSGTADDECQMINIGTGQPFNMFPGLSANEASRLISRAMSQGATKGAIEQAQRAYKEGVKTVRIYTEDIHVGEPYVGTPDIQCQDFMSASDCRILFNVCDPVVCPSSRCDLGGAYPVQDVVQSGIVGSTFLCLNNWPEVKVPVCLSGINAGLDSFATMIDSYEQCLNNSLETGQTVGICDQIRSVYACDFVWRELAPAGKYIAGKALGQNTISGGGEYLGFQSALDTASQSVDYFTDYYAKNSIDAFKARSIESAGTTLCRSAIFGSYPTGGSFFDALVTPDSPHQFYGSFDEIPETTVTNPPTSHYKVFYHIYAGKDSRAYYEVYLKGTESSFFQDTGFKRIVANGFLAAGEYATNTEDFTAPSGYKELCINVNGQEECGFQEVSTSYLVNRAKDLYVQDQVANTNIKSEAECVSGTPGVTSAAAGLLGSGGNIQQAIEEGAPIVGNPEIYNRGIIRFCATDNPGKGSDPYADTPNSRFKDVGYCGDTNVKCWLDTQSVETAIKSLDIEQDTINQFNNQTLDILKNENPDAIVDFDAFVNEFESLNATKIIKKVTQNLGNVFLNYERAYLYLLRGDAYAELAKRGYDGFLRQQEETGGPEEFPDEFMSPVFELKDGPPNSNLYYRYLRGGWYWATTPRAFEIGNDNSAKIDPDSINVALSDSEKALIKSLAQASYRVGLVKLTAEIKPKIGFDPKLVTDNADYTSEGMFVLHLNGQEVYFRKGNTLYTNKPVNKIYFEYDFGNRQWKWSIDKENWIDVPNIETTFGVVEKVIPAQQNIRLIIQRLEGKLFVEGAGIIFSKDSTVDVNNIVVTSSSSSSQETTSQSDSETTQASSENQCSSETECQQITGQKIIEIANNLKKGKTFANDEVVFKDTGSKNFECLALQVAYVESNLRHCQSVSKSISDGPFYCENTVSELRKGAGEESYGVMQINIDAHPDIGNYGDFENNVKYGVNLLLDLYNSDEKLYKCYEQTVGDYVTVTYSGWERALRNYNGWNAPPNCAKGNTRYVSVVESYKDEIAVLFPEKCG